MARPTPQDLLREFAQLNKRRKSEGITPLELQRWTDLHTRLSRSFPDRPPLPTGGVVRVRIGFDTLGELRDSIMANVRPMGIFVNTPFAPEADFCFSLRVYVKASDETYDADVRVISNNVGPGFSTAALGMGLRFTEAESTLRSALDRLYDGGPRAQSDPRP